MTKEEALKELQDAHDAIREHPYRLSFSSGLERDYNEKLYDLSHAWCDLIYRSDVQGEERGLLLKFGDWIHNYNASLLGYHVRRDLIPFYEAVLSVTHRYLDTREINGYCSLEYRKNEYGGRDEVPMMFYVVTQESCGIDSPKLPTFFPMYERLSEDNEAVRSYLKKRWFNKSQEEIDKIVDDWERNLLPVIKWHNRSMKQGLPEAPLYRAI